MSDADKGRAYRHTIWALEGPTAALELAEECIASLEAEVTRLRAALEAIREQGEKYINDAVMDWDEVQDIAREALESGGK